MSDQNILITGASGGIGSALARVYARPGTTLLLWGRDAKRGWTRLRSAMPRSRARWWMTQSIRLCVTRAER